jgi:hypothetical protein
MPTYKRSEDEVERDIRLADRERAYEMDLQVQRDVSAIEMAKEKGRIQIEKTKITHRAEQRSRVWITFFQIIPKSILIISSFWLIVFNKEVPEYWKEYLKE